MEVRKQLTLYWQQLRQQQQQRYQQELEMIQSWWTGKNNPRKELHGAESVDWLEATSDDDSSGPAAVRTARWWRWWKAVVCAVSCKTRAQQAPSVTRVHHSLLVLLRAGCTVSCALQNAGQYVASPSTPLLPMHAVIYRSASDQDTVQLALNWYISLEALNSQFQFYGEEMISSETDNGGFATSRMMPIYWLYHLYALAQPLTPEHGHPLPALQAAYHRRCRVLLQALKITRRGAAAYHGYALPQLEHYCISNRCRQDEPDFPYALSLVPRLKNSVVCYSCLQAIIQAVAATQVAAHSP